MLERHRNVLTRAERVVILQETGLWSEGGKITGLPKVAHRKAAVGKKDKAEKKPEGVEGAPAAAAAAPAATKEKEKPAKSAKPAKGGKS
jgi:small basic protein (TIGR04137 family)